MATYYRKTMQFKREIFTGWVESTVIWTYTGSRIISSSADQQSGWVFPNIARGLGITKLSFSTNYEHIYSYKKSIGAGVSTPWGDVKIYEQQYTDYIHVYGNEYYWIDKD